MFPEHPNEPPSNGTPRMPPEPRAELWVSPEQYLEAERRATTKSQYLNGRVLAMSGASRKHNLVVGNLVAALHRRLEGRPCEVYPSDMRLRVPETGLYTYPDVTVVCAELRLEDTHFDTLLNPTVLFEVLSPSTASDDRGWKGAHYRRIPSLEEYLLVPQDEPRVERYRRHGEAEWLITEVEGIEASVELASIGCALSLREVYERVL
jgi:Uma2 family endonuclease